ncbi:MAG: hypothetical protein K5656_09610 [Lachnospiraceae bacterium]|nr:hypothetical protein [Lachnospiraceae bacterium]
MNYGRFFRLNQNLSRIEEGFAIYDYIDLPAYFAPSMSNRMSPKYPISVMITSNSVTFRLHYSALKIERKEKEGNEDNANLATVESNNITSKYPKYYYDYEITDTLRADLQKEKPVDITKIAHMAEVILELPYTDTANRSLSDTIKSIYHTNFPQMLKLNNANSEQKESTGGRFLEGLIRKRYHEDGKQIKTNEVDSIFYEALRKVSDGTTSYSTLWLMELVQGEKHGSRYCRTNNGRKIVGFLRKLLLDFMFDLKHSDVFQNSIFYQAMYSGLMSDFYFSALMHKCEYYYYRELITDEISQIGKEEKTEECDNKETKRKNHGDRLNRLRFLYAQELFKAEDLWIKDIMSPSSEIYFEHYNIKDKKEGETTFRRKVSQWLKKGRIFYEKSLKQRDFDVWNSWFANPEEEMRRVCFAKKDNKDIIHLCNAETLAEYLDLSKHDNEAVSKQMIKDKDNFKVAISQWFLKRYDFKDVMHLHLFKRAHWLLFSSIIAVVGLLFFNPTSVTDTFWNENRGNIIVLSLVLVLIILLWKCQSLIKLFRFDLIGVNKRIILRRICGIITNVALVIVALFVFPGFISNYFPSFRADMNDESTRGTFCKFIVIFSQVTIVLGGGWLVNKLSNLRLLANMHIFYPRLIASIAAAWLSLAIGNELFGTFFDSIVSWSTSIWLTVIVFVFVMYEVNKMLPYELAWNKFSRCLGIIAISYMISLIVGLFIINFTGERFLERSDTLENFYVEYVRVGNDTIKNEKQVDNTRYRFVTPSRRDLADKQYSDADRLKGLEEVYINTNGENNRNHPIVTTWELDDAKFFILRDFLIQFAFVAMFIGIFIQMLFEDKTITET